MIKILVCQVGKKPEVVKFTSAWDYAKNLLAIPEDSDPTIQIVRLDDAAHTAAADDNDTFAEVVVEFCLRG